jgi:hypothetical protein
MRDGDGSLPHATIQRSACWRTRQLHFLAPIHFVLEKAFCNLQDSNNPLAAELERENDLAREIFLSCLSDFISVETATPVGTARIYSNVQHVEA